MADEFMKGFGILVTAGLGWMTLAGWYNTPGFEETQLIAEDPTVDTFFGEMALLLKDALFWLAILGAITFWVVIPAYRIAREKHAGSSP